VTWPIFLSATAESREQRLTMLGAIGSNVPVVRPHPTEPDVYADGTEEELNEAVRITLTLWDDKAPYKTMNAVYQQLAERIRTGRIQYKPVYLDDQPGKLDLTLCVIGKDPVLDIAKRVGGYGRTIEEMLARRQEQTSRDRPPVQMASEVGRDARLQQRGAYKGALEQWMASEVLARWRRMSLNAIAREFVKYCKAKRPDVLPLLPKRLRSMEPAIERIITRRVNDTKAAASKTTAAKSQ
jgi:hypothetical protein